MNTVNRASTTVHHGLRLTPASELAGAHTPGWLRPQRLDRVTSTQRGQAGILTTSFNSSEVMRIGPTTMDQSGGGLELDEGQYEVGRGETRGSNELQRKWVR
jgi:hypothetical protein